MMRKLMRTAQRFFPGGRNAREAVSRYIRRVRKRPHEEDFLALQHFPPGHLLLDIGTNYGQSIDSMLLMQPCSQIIGYEANRKLAERMAALFQGDRRVTIEPFGLSDRSGTFDLYVPYYRNFAYPGLASIHPDGATTLLSPTTLLFYREEHVSVQRLKCQLNTLDQQNVSPYFIKLDVQGAELNVLRGGADTLTRSLPILLIEAPEEDSRIHPFLRSLGYDAFEYTNGKFRIPVSSGNRFFLTKSRLDELSQKNPGLFV